MSRRTWPIWVLATPAAVAIWGGWVELGRMCGYGPVTPLPGIADDFTIDLSITLPIGVEALAAYALSVALSPADLARPVRTFARFAVTVSLLIGAAGQIAFHLLVAAGRTTAPPALVAAVAVLPVITLALGAGLAHLIDAYPPPATGTTKKDTTTDEIPTDRPALPTNLQTTSEHLPQGHHLASDRPDRVLAPASTGRLRDLAGPHRSEPDPAITPTTTPAAAKRTATKPVGTTKKTTTPTTGVDVVALATAHPDWTQAQLAEAAGVSESTVKRRLRAARTAATAVSPTPPASAPPAPPVPTPEEVAA